MRLKVNNTELRLALTNRDNIWLVENLSDLDIDAFVQAPDVLQILDDDGNVVAELIKNRITLIFEHDCH